MKEMKKCALWRSATYIQDMNKLILGGTTVHKLDENL